MSKLVRVKTTCTFTNMYVVEVPDYVEPEDTFDYIQNIILDDAVEYNQKWGGEYIDEYKDTTFKEVREEADYGKEWSDEVFTRNMINSIDLNEMNRMQSGAELVNLLTKDKE